MKPKYNRLKQTDQNRNHFETQHFCDKQIHSKQNTLSIIIFDKKKKILTIIFKCTFSSALHTFPNILQLIVNLLSTVYINVLELK